MAHGSQLGLEWALSRLELISQLAKAADGEQSFFLIPPPFHPLCSVRNWERSQVFATRPFLPGLAESVAKSSAVLDGSGNYRARTCRISNIVKCFITASKCFMLRKKCKQWPAITLSLQSSQDHFANMETFNDHISQWSNRELRVQSKMIQTISCTYWAFVKTQSIVLTTRGLSNLFWQMGVGSADLCAALGLAHGAHGAPPLVTGEHWHNWPYHHRCHHDQDDQDDQDDLGWSRCLQVLSIVQSHASTFLSLAATEYSFHHVRLPYYADHDLLLYVDQSQCS